MASAEIEIVGRLPYSTNHTFLVRCCDPDRQSEEPLLAVYKPVAGERPLYDFPNRTLYRREIAAYKLDQALGWGFVPLTVERSDGPLGPGAVQVFIDHHPEEHYFNLLEGHRSTFRRLAMFDLLCNNADRKGGHCLLSADGHIWAVDHGLTFHALPKIRTVIWDFAGEELPAAERSVIRLLGRRLADKSDEIRQELRRLLADNELKALLQRAKALQQPGVFPQPDSSWSFPWPLV